MHTCNLNWIITVLRLSKNLQCDVVFKNYYGKTINNKSKSILC